MAESADAEHGDAAAAGAPAVRSALKVVIPAHSSGAASTSDSSSGIDASAEASTTT